MDSHHPPFEWAFITVTFNSRAQLQEHWADLHLPPTAEWIVVDNASTDDSVDLAKSLGARVIALPNNVGFGAANNVGFRASNAPYVAFVNPDLTPRLSDLETLRDWLKTHPKDLIAPQLTNPDGTLQPNGRGLPYLAYKAMHRLRPELIERRYRRFAAEDEAVTVDWFIGAAVIGNRQWLELLGPWDERFFVYYEDSDLGLRNSAQGGRSVVLGGCRWMHGWARETGGFNVAAWKLEIASMTKFYSRYPALLSPIPGAPKAETEIETVNT